VGSRLAESSRRDRSQLRLVSSHAHWITHVALHSHNCHAV
jgi:hypothetical protein